MGRTEPTIVKPPAAFRRDARAKRARATLNKVIPAMLSAHPRARRGVERSELVVDPPALPLSSDGKRRDAAASNGRSAEVKTAGRQKKKKRNKKMEEDHRDNDEEEEKGETSRSTAHCPPPPPPPPRITLHVGDALTAAQALLLSHGSQNQKNQHQHQHQGSVGAEAFGRTYKKVGVLNMASPLAPGGGFLNGATGPEASLCLRTTLLPALRDEFYRLPELGVAYTPDVLVFRPGAAAAASNKRSTGDGSEGDEDDVLPKNDRWFVDVASAAMLRLPETTDGGGDGWYYVSASDRALAERKMRAVLRVFAARGCEAVVLGAWGCGAHEGNPVSEIAAAWRRVLGVEVGEDRHHHHGEDHDNGLARRRLSGEGKDKVVVVGKVRGGGGAGGAGGEEKNDKKRNNNKEKGKEKREPWGAYISDVVFAIKDRGTATAFARAFGEDYIVASSASSPSSTAGDDEEEEEREEEDPVQVARMSELREKIAELEMQAAQVRSPHLKAGLESVLAGLRRQLPPVGDNDDDEDGDGVSSPDRGRECFSETEEDEDD
ncbi:hypothetical protein F4680DRAFT_165464 [Xylaria scruposa]|nr:hypothetical protein F4680DRAFT_165464 [Xylaria scruposa]